MARGRGGYSAFGGVPRNQPRIFPYRPTAPSPRLNFGNNNTMPYRPRSAYPSLPQLSRAPSLNAAAPPPNALPVTRPAIKPLPTVSVAKTYSSPLPKTYKAPSSAPVLPVLRKAEPIVARPATAAPTNNGFNWTNNSEQRSDDRPKTEKAKDVDIIQNRFTNTVKISNGKTEPQKSGRFTTDYSLSKPKAPSAVNSRLLQSSTENTTSVKQTSSEIQVI